MNTDKVINDNKIFFTQSIYYKAVIMSSFPDKNYTYIRTFLYLFTDKVMSQEYILYQYVVGKYVYSDTLCHYAEVL